MAPPRVGRKRSIVAEYVVKGGTNSKNQTTYSCAAEGCAYSKETQTWTASYWADHIVGCTFTADEVKVAVAKSTNTAKTRAFLSTLNSPPPRALRQKAPALEEEGGEEESPSICWKKRSAPAGSAGESKRARGDAVVSAAIAKFVVGCGLPFDVVKNTFFLDMVRALNSGYDVPPSEEFRRSWSSRIFDDAVAKIDEMWAGVGNPRRVVGLGGDERFVCVASTARRKTAFEACVERGEPRSAEILRAQLVERARRAGKSSVEETYVGFLVVVRGNSDVVSCLAPMFPRLFFAGCAARCLESTIEAVVVEIREFKTLKDIAIFLAVFVRNHDVVRARFETIVGEAGGKMVLSRSRRSDEIIARCFANARNLEQLVFADDWGKVAAGIEATRLDKFERYIRDQPFRKMWCLHELLGPVAAAVSHVETRSARLSWVLVLFSAVRADAEAWARKSSTKHYFSADAIKAATDAVNSRWLGSRSWRGDGVVDPLHVVAWLVDPFTTPTQDELVQTVPGWEHYCLEVLESFYPDAAAEALSELEQIVLRRGDWGVLVERKQRSLVTPPADQRFKTSTEREIFKQSRMMSVAEDWRLVGVKQFPKIAPVAIRLDEMAVHSRDVDRVCCKVNELLHKPRLSATVHRLLFTYVNLRLLNDCIEEDNLGHFLALSNCDDAEEPSFLEDEKNDQHDHAAAVDDAAFVAAVLDDDDDDTTSPAEI